MSDYRKNSEYLIVLLGGPDNINTVSNCMTRLRITVRDEAKVDEEKLRTADDVLGLVHDRPLSYEIVVGPGKSTKYDNQFKALGLGNSPDENTKDDWKSNKKALQSGQKGNRVKSILKLLGDIFVPLIPGVITAGLCAGFAALITEAVPDYDTDKVWSIVYNILMLVNKSFMTYLTAWAGYRSAERFGATPILGGMLGMITSLDGIDNISKMLGLYDDKNVLNSVLHTGKGGVLAVIMGVFILSIVEKKIRSKMPDSVDIIFTPLLSLLICVVPYILIIMPIFGYISTGIVWFFSKLCLSSSVIVRCIAGYLSAALFLPLVATGMHHGLVALYSVQLDEIGHITLYPALAMAGAGQVGAAIAIWVKARRVGNKKLCSVISGALPAGFLGIGEPLIYGVTLPLGKPFITAGLGAGFGGAIVMAMEVASTTWGPSGILGMFVMTAGPLGAGKSVLVYLVGLVVSYVCSFVITDIFYSEKELLIDKTGLYSPEHNSGKTSVQHGDAITLGENSAPVAAPADGKLISMKDIPDPAFSDGTMGDCIGILPENGKIYAPCDGKVAVIAETKHAIFIEADDGRNILVHAGIDTVKLDGKGFTVPVSTGDTVKKGNLILEMDLDIVAQAGLSPMIITAESS